ncbi:DUF1997 domain-containing protein [Roseofilum casamattae]|uniref:DUF1997 domain-containing protein n=1 Tax=Roseofilum casamattae BLCC-M143 TaxID=3022442 RepID=A0ABT7BXM6_9CYAN|nr:DUF1997 domain-containing protein [Roseofilum casamattae]MDJ1183944.1 DUF1997 domain-containing protein [Roseofilum casamattae BLCC-M143]
MKLESSAELSQTTAPGEVFLGAVSDFTSAVPMEVATNPAIAFSTVNQGKLTFNAPPEVVARYFDDHQGWFARCAAPMQVQPMGQNGYTLVIGRFGSFGYEVEPKVGLEMKSHLPGMYTIESIPLPEDGELGYEVDFRSTMQLVEGHNNTVTYAEWKLDLKANVRFPQFIYTLPKGLIQKTGDRLLNQIVKQVSHRLNQKVVDDFHQNYSTQ